MGTWKDCEIPRWKGLIAVRCDHFGGEPWDEDTVAEIHKETEAIKAKFPKPPKRK